MFHMEYNIKTYYTIYAANTTYFGKGSVHILWDRFRKDLYHPVLT